LRAGSVILRPREAMDWHSTGSREELVILLAGRVQIEADASGRPAPGGGARLARRSPRRSGGGPCRRRWPLRAGQCAFIPRETSHRVVNRSQAIARYLYVTARAS
jgi:mannose-6-phosphate isomerase-like protein (cupin superfamily)